MNSASSSSNPFHRPVHSSEPEHASAAPSRPLSNPRDDFADPPPRPPKASSSRNQTSGTTKKQVRIESPARRSRTPSPRYDEHGPNYPHQGAYNEFTVARAPPNQSYPSLSRHDLDSNSSGSSSSSDDEYTMAAVMAEQRPSTTNVPHNPFSRTLADMEESLGSKSVEKQSPERAEEGNHSSTSQPTATARATMDVNAFKTLLMTGRAAPSGGDAPVAPAPAPAPSHRSAPVLADNGSSTDTSSVSRQSILDNMTHETPRSSYERPRSDGEEEETTAVPQRTQSKRVKPPLPRHRHGKSVSGPQIVAFDDFSNFGQEQDVASTEERSKARVSGEGKRPLPPTPVARSSMREALAQASNRGVSRDPTPSPDISERPSSQSRMPPPPPLARRSSQRNPVASLERTRSGQSSSRPYLADDNESIAESTTSSTRVAPPPPPTRRSGHASSHSITDDAPSPASSISRTPSLKSPPPPPARHRASSNLSATSIPPPSSLSTTPTTSSSNTTTRAPKPPPPRRTSSRSSIEITSPRRTSGEYMRSSFDSDRRPSISSSVRRVPITEETSTAAGDESAIITSPMTDTSGNKKDILADMDAFQREIDALMAKDELGKRKSSSGSTGSNYQRMENSQ